LLALQHFVLALAQSTLMAEWSPPAQPNPRVILDEARADVAAGRHEDALAKYVWFFRNAVKIDKALAGVRGSYVVSEWSALGRTYPPALAKLKAVRDDIVEQVKQGKDVKAAFLDVEAINEAFGDDHLTYDLFLELDAKRPQLAKDAYRTVQRILIAKKKYKLCSKYLDVEEGLLRLTRAVQTLPKVHEIGKFSPGQRAKINKVVIDDCATFIALLAINDRHDDALKVAKAIRKEWDDPAFRAAIDQALKGKLPEA